MKVIIPLAGKGTRLRPHTHITPKPMLKVAGKPVMEYILEDLRRLGTVEQIIYITGHLKEKVEEYARSKFADIPGTFIEQTTEATAQLIGLNTIAVTRLAGAVAPRFVQEGKGAIINIGSVVGLAPELGLSVYGATKAFVIFLSQGLQLELGPKGVYVQAVLPAATRTDIWAKSGKDVNAIPGMMEVDEMVDAALVGFDASVRSASASRFFCANTSRSSLVISAARN